MKNKMTLILGAVVCGIGIWTANLFAFSTISKPLLEFSYTSGGDMRGSYHFTSVKPLDKDYAIIVTGKRGWYGIDAVSHEYKVSKGILEGIKEIFNKHRMGNSDKAFESPFKVLDKGTSSYSFVFEKKRVEFDSERMLSEDTRLGIREILDYIEKECKKGEKLPGLEDQKMIGDKPNNLQRPISGKLALEVYDYKGKEMYVRIANGLTEPKEFALSYKLYKQGAEKTLIAEKQISAHIKVFPNRSEEHTYELLERLQAGEYLLEIADLKTSFVLK